MVGSILLGLVIWFFASIPVGILVGKMLARANQASAPMPSGPGGLDVPVRSAALGEQLGYVSPIKSTSRDA